MPRQILGVGPQTCASREVERPAVTGLERGAFGTPVGELVARDDDAQVFVDRPKSLVERPVSVGREGEPVSWVVVAGVGKRSDVRGPRSTFTAAIEGRYFASHAEDRKSVV